MIERPWCPIGTPAVQRVFFKRSGGGFAKSVSIMWCTTRLPVISETFHPRLAKGAESEVVEIVNADYTED